MSDAAPRNWTLYINDMTVFAERVLAYTDGLDQSGFVDSGITYDATLRNLELIGEAASRIPADLREAHPTIPWRMLVATRNRLIHAYLGIDDDIIWSIVTRDVPVLLSELRRLVERLHSG